MRAARLPAAIVPYRAPNPSARAPCRVALSSSDAAVTSGASAAQLRQLVEHAQDGADARLSVPIATGTPAA